MPAPEKPTPLKIFRKRLDAARKDRAFLKERQRRERDAQKQRKQWENTQKAREKELAPSVLDLPGVWLEKRRKAKRRQEEKRQYASLGADPQASPIPGGWLGKAARAWFAGITSDRERLWRRVAGALGAIAVLLLVCCLVIYFRFTPARPLVTVGNRVIQRREYQDDLDAAAGKSVLTNLVFSELIRQAAAKAGVTPTPAQIDARLAQIAQHGTPSPPGMSAAQIRDRMALTLALENLRVQGVPASDAEIEDFYRKNAGRFAQPARVESILVLTQSEFEAQAATSLLAKGKTAAEVAAQPDMHVDGENGFHLNFNALPVSKSQQIRLTALSMQIGQITTLPLGNFFLTIKCLHKDAANQPSLSQIREEVALMVKLSKAPSASAELARLYQTNPPKFDMQRYSAYFSDVEHADQSATDAAPKPAGP